MTQRYTFEEVAQNLYIFLISHTKNVNLKNELKEIPPEFHESFGKKWQDYHNVRKNIFTENISSSKSSPKLSNRILKTRIRHNFTTLNIFELTA